MRITTAISFDRISIWYISDFSVIFDSYVFCCGRFTSTDIKKPSTVCNIAVNVVVSPLSRRNVFWAIVFPFFCLIRAEPLTRLSRLLIRVKSEFLSRNCSGLDKHPPREHNPIAARNFRRFIFEYLCRIRRIRFSVSGYETRQYHWFSGAGEGYPRMRCRSAEVRRVFYQKHVNNSDEVWIHRHNPKFNCMYPVFLFKQTPHTWAIM